MEINNSENRLIDVFFYGLYMDPVILKAKGVEPRKPRKGVAKGFRLRIGKLATLIREPEAEAYGIVYALTHSELNQLYWGTGLDAYVAEALLVDIEGNGEVVALCCNLLIPPEDDEKNPGYRGKLVQSMNRLELPAPSSSDP